MSWQSHEKIAIEWCVQASASISGGSQQKVKGYLHLLTRLICTGARGERSARRDCFRKTHFLDGERLRWRFIISPFVPLSADTIPFSHYYCMQQRDRTLTALMIFRWEAPLLLGATTTHSIARPTMRCSRGKSLARGVPEQWLKSSITTRGLFAGNLFVTPRSGCEKFAKILTAWDMRACQGRSITLDQGLTFDTSHFSIIWFTNYQCNSIVICWIYFCQNHEIPDQLLSC